MLAFDEARTRLIHSLTIEEQEALIEILRRQIAKDIEESQREFSEGKCRGVTPGQWIDEMKKHE
jgi:hypothetical protein